MIATIPLPSMEKKRSKKNPLWAPYPCLSDALEERGKGLGKKEGHLFFPTSVAHARSK